ncbi:MAG: hypothetical protein HND52_18180 [Ignavibacteriae bacterium]|nr:hypothetical protein [Ignavibacteriota bacterium]NOG99891.1 hypothetical protein [Ignavibacteriota bacterium]
MKFKVGKQSFCSSLNSCIYAILFYALAFPNSGLAKTTFLLDNSTPSDSVKIYLHQLRQNPNLDDVRIKLIDQLINYGLYSIAYEQINYLKPGENADSSSEALKQKILKNYKPISGIIYRDSKLELEKQNLLNSINIKQDADNSGRLLSKLNKYKPDDPDLLNLSIMVDKLFAGKFNEKEKKKSAENNKPVKLPKSNFTSKNVNPFDFHKGLKVVPTTYIYHDDVEFQYLVGGINAEVGLNNILGFGVNFQRGHIRIPEKLMRIKRAEVSLFIKPVKNLLLSANIGEDLIGDEKSPTADVELKYEVFPKFKFNISYTRNDAALVFNSYHLISKRILVNLARLRGEYSFNKSVKLIGYYELLKTNNTVMAFESVKRKFPSNYGNNFLIGISKGFGKYFTAGVEYFYSDFENTLPIYYSPQNYSHQSLYCSIYIFKRSRVKINFGGKFGYISNEDSALKELNSKMSFTVYSKLIIELNAYYNLTKRYSGNYDSSALSISAYWSLIK